MKKLSHCLSKDYEALGSAGRVEDEKHYIPCKDVTSYMYIIHTVQNLPQKKWLYHKKGNEIIRLFSSLPLSNIAGMTDFVSFAILLAQQPVGMDNRILLL